MPLYWTYIHIYYGFTQYIYLWCEKKRQIIDHLDIHFLNLYLYLPRMFDLSTRNTHNLNIQINGNDKIRKQIFFSFIKSYLLFYFWNQQKKKRKEIPFD